MERYDGRKANELRPVQVTRHFTRNAAGSVLIEVGHTKVICTAMVEDKVPPFLRGSKKGWVTAEYEMLPSATESRKSRDRSKGKVDGRTVEIQRLIGRSLRSVMDMEKLGERTIWIDCDVIQADGGTRTASITGAFIALYDAVQALLDDGIIEETPLTGFVAATSMGIWEDEAILDLCYLEDSSAIVDMNLIMTDQGEIIEIQGTGEGRPFTKMEMAALLELGEAGIKELIAIQKNALGLTQDQSGKDGLKTIVLATGNKDKAKEIKSMLDHQFEVLTMKEAGIDVEIIEDGETFEDNALIKVRAIKPFMNDPEMIIMGDDSGLSVDCLDGAPGVYSARYAGEDVTYTDNNLKLLEEMKDVPEEKRGAEFVSVIAMILPNGEEHTVRGTVRGKIAFDFTGEEGFGYDPLFIEAESGKSYAQMSADEKNAVSHRARAVEQAKGILFKDLK